MSVLTCLITVRGEPAPVESRDFAPIRTQDGSALVLGRSQGGHEQIHSCQNPPSHLVSGSGRANTCQKYIKFAM